MSETAVRLHRKTRDDYRALPEGPPYYELIDGELIEMTRPSELHNEIALTLAEWWRAHLRTGVGGALSIEPNLYLPNLESVYHPDLAYIAPEQRSIRKRDGIYGVPQVICEILSPSTASLDRSVKLNDYRRAGVPHVWLVDPVRPVLVQEFVLGESGAYSLHSSLTAPAEWEPAAFPGWTISLAELDAAVASVEEASE
ncbi:MAG: Uma2 family endonuclease [Armatimonadota bacterium]